MVTVVVTAFIIAFGFGMVSNFALLMILSDVNGALEPGRQFPWFFSSFYMLRIFSEHRRLYPASSRRRILAVGCCIVSLSAMMIVMGSILWHSFHNSSHL
jgi:prolipoprotein diacylglyceryltransferase